MRNPSSQTSPLHVILSPNSVPLPLRMPASQANHPANTHLQDRTKVYLLILILYNLSPLHVQVGLPFLSSFRTVPSGDFTLNDKEVLILHKSHRLSNLGLTGWEHLAPCNIFTCTDLFGVKMVIFTFWFSLHPHILNFSNHYPSDNHRVLSSSLESDHNGAGLTQFN